MYIYEEKKVQQAKRTFGGVDIKDARDHFRPTGQNFIHSETVGHSAVENIRTRVHPKSISIKATSIRIRIL